MPVAEMKLEYCPVSKMHGLFEGMVCDANAKYGNNA